MPESTVTLQVEMPLPDRLALQEHVWTCLASLMNVDVCFVLPAQATGWYRVRSPSGSETMIEIRHSPDRFSTHHLTAHPVAVGDHTFLLPSPAAELVISFEGRCVSVEQDVILALLSLLHLWEEHEIPYRDRFGLVEGSRSPRCRADLLSEPLVENVACWLAAVLELDRPSPYPGMRDWAVGFSSDVDLLDSDHMPRVLRFLDDRGVERPTFMICPPNSDERVIHDPQYNFADAGTRRLLAPLLEADVEIGLHGSYLAHDRLDMLLAQKRRLENWCERRVVGHRAHFYRFAYPRSWAWQYRAGLRYDASLGYPDLPGLRGGHFSPLPMLDPEGGTVPFYVTPTAVLDQHFFWPAAWPRDAFEKYADRLINNARLTKSVLILDWHSYTISDGYAGWWDCLDYLLNRAVEQGAFVAGISTILGYRDSLPDNGSGKEAR